MIPKRPNDNLGKTYFADDYTLHYIAHLEAVASRAVEALRWVMHSIHNSELIPDYQGAYDEAKEATDEILASGWKP